MALSDYFVKNWYIIFGGIGLGIYFFLQAWKRSPKMQMFMDRLFLKLPIFGPVIRKATIARWLRTLSTMFAAGVPLVEALDSVGGAAGNIVYLQATKKIQQEVSTGTSLTVAMNNANVFPNMVLQMASIGEESGSLDSMLGKSADVYEREVDDAVESLSSLMEPLIDGGAGHADRWSGGGHVPAHLQAGSGGVILPSATSGRRGRQHAPPFPGNRGGHARMVALSHFRGVRTDSPADTPSRQHMTAGIERRGLPGPRQEPGKQAWASKTSTGSRPNSP